jgi:hypothetical protein
MRGLWKLSGAAVVAAAAAGSGLYFAASGPEPTAEDQVTITVTWPQPRDSAGAIVAPVWYEWTTFYRIRLYRSGVGYDPEARGLIAAGTTADTSVAVTVERPHPLDSLIVWTNVRALTRRGLHGATTRGAQQLIEGYADSLAMFQVFTADSVIRSQGVALQPSYAAPASTPIQVAASPFCIDPDSVAGPRWFYVRGETSQLAPVVVVPDTVRYCVADQTSHPRWFFLPGVVVPDTAVLCIQGYKGDSVYRTSCPPAGSGSLVLRYALVQQLIGGRARLAAPSNR